MVPYNESKYIDRARYDGESMVERLTCLRGTIEIERIRGCSVQCAMCSVQCECCNRAVGQTVAEAPRSLAPVRLVE